MTHTKPPRKSYSEKLKDPRWQKKRLEILTRDSFACQECGDETSTLHVHHLAYHGDPWLTPNNLLMTLCEGCHTLEEESLRDNAECLIKELKLAGFTGWAMQGLVKVFKGKDRDWKYNEPAFDILKMVVHDDKLWEEMEELFWKRERMSRGQNG